MDNVEIRDMTAADYPAASELVRELHAVHAQARPDWYRPNDAPMSRDEYEKMLSDGWTLLLAERVGEPVGLCFGYFRNMDTPITLPIPTFHIQDFVVSERLRREGVGRTLFQHVKARALGMGARRLTLSVWAFNAPALALYRGMGMTERTLNMELELAQGPK